MGKPTQLPDGTYHRGGQRFVVRGGVMEALEPEAPPAAAAPPTPQDRSGAPEWAWDMSDRLKSWANAGTFGLPEKLGLDSKEELQRVTSEHPTAAMVGAVTSPVNRLLPGGGGMARALGRTAVRTAEGANYADSINGNPYLGGAAAGAGSLVGEGLVGGLGKMSKLAQMLKDRFGAHTELPGKLAGASEALQQGVSSMSVPVSQAISAQVSAEKFGSDDPVEEAKAQEDEEYRKAKRKALKVDQ